MSLNKLSNQQNTGSERWMHITCKDILADELKGDQVIANSVTAVVTTSDIINSDDKINAATVDADLVKCNTLEFENVNRSFPIRTYYTDQTIEMTHTSPETNILTGGIGALTYTGNDAKGSETIISSQFTARLYPADVYLFRIYRGGKLLSEYSYGNTLDFQANNERLDVKWIITTRNVGVSGQLLVQFQMQRSKGSDGIQTETSRYNFSEISDDTTLSGNLEFTIEPSAVSPFGNITTSQSSVSRSV